MRSRGPEVCDLLDLRCVATLDVEREQLPWRVDAREVALGAFALASDGAKGPKVCVLVDLSCAFSWT